MIFQTRNLKNIGITLAGIILTFTGLGITPSQAILNVTPHSKDVALNIPDAVGRAGMAAGTVTESQNKNSTNAQVIIATGGANFPNEKPWDGGKKVFYSDIYKFTPENNTFKQAASWEKIGNLPEPIAYAAFASTPKGLIVAGGTNELGTSNKAYFITPEGHVSTLPSLPHPIAYASSLARNGKLYIFGGQESESSTTALKTCYTLDISKLPDSINTVQWEKLPDMPVEGRILSTVGVSGKLIYIIGGTTLSPNAEGKAQRTYLKEVIGFDATQKEQPWVTLHPQTNNPIASVPTTIAGSPSPAPSREDRLLVLGGDTGSHYGQNPQTHPGQNADIYEYNSIDNTWTKLSQWPIGIATAPTAVINHLLYTISGETKPGVRTPTVSTASLDYALDMHLVDYAIFGLIIVIIAILIFQIRKNGIKGVSTLAHTDTKVSKYAWVVVGLLWVVAMLNYFDRQLLTTIREPIVRDIPQTEMQFGMLTGVFLLIYSVLSPIGGFLADRFSRRVVILCSLIVWSTVTWITGHVNDYTTLLWARAFMGISEACYIPAALALITDYHRGRTRSLATGIHMSGIYAGMAMAGLGGTLAEATGWRLTFGLFGLVGVGYAFILVLFLHDPKPEENSEKVAEKIINATSQDSPSMREALRSLLSSGPLWVLMIVVACAGAANWFLLAWFPTLLQEKFNLGLSEAGTNATLWSTMAKYIAVLGGAVIADQWSVHNPKGRSLLPGFFFLISGPLIILSPFIPAEMAGAMILLLVFVASQGLAQGTLDATLMPVMRSHVGGRFAATGYGILNLVSAGFGAFTVIYGGKLKDMGIELSTTLAYSGALLFIGGICLLLLPRPKKNED